MSTGSAETERRTETIPEWKRREVADLADYLARYESVGVVDITGIPSRQLQDMRRDLHGSAELRVSRNTLLVRALEEAGLDELVGEVSGQVGLIGTNENPFGLYQQLEASKTSAPINAGEVAPNDIVIPEGDTGMDPGPFVGELQSVGANARIEDGSIKVLEDSQVLDAGEEVSGDLANVLSELGIEPKEVGLDLRAVVADGVLFEPADLELDVEEYRADVQAAAARGRNLSVNAAIPTAATVSALLGKATGEAKGLGLAAAIEDPGVLPDLLARADGQVRALAARVDDPDALPEQLQDVDAAEPAEEADGTEEQTDDQEASSETEPDDADADAEAEADDGDDDNDDGAGEALGDMFGD
jgi:large subunit ribosomal protein L10